MIDGVMDGCIGIGFGIALALWGLSDASQIQITYRTTHTGLEKYSTLPQSIVLVRIVIRLSSSSHSPVKEGVIASVASGSEIREGDAPFTCPVTCQSNVNRITKPIHPLVRRYLPHAALPSFPGQILATWPFL